MRLPFNLGIGGAVQTGFKYALEHGYQLAVRLDGDGQHDPTELGKLLDPVRARRGRHRHGLALRQTATAPTGRRSRGGSASPGSPRSSRCSTRQRVTDTTSGFQALNERGIALFAGDYPSDYPEVEATVLVFKHRLRLAEVPVQMREREHGESSITFVRSIYYMLKVTLALFVAMVRKYAVPEEEAAHR